MQGAYSGAVSIDTASPIAPFEQVRTQIAAMVTSGQLPAGVKLPTVRQLALDLGLAANTVARSYRELEADGVIATHGRRGTFVSSMIDNPDVSPVTAQLGQAAARYVTSARRAGISMPEAVRLVELAWAGPGTAADDS